MDPARAKMQMNSQRPIQGWKPKEQRSPVVKGMTSRVRMPTFQCLFHYCGYEFVQIAFLSSTIAFLLIKWEELEYLFIKSDTVMQTRVWHIGLHHSLL